MQDLRGVRSKTARAPESEDEPRPGSVAHSGEETTSRRQDVFKDWLANYLRRLDCVSGGESTSAEPRPAARETARSSKNVERKRA